MKITLTDDKPEILEFILRLQAKFSPVSSAADELVLAFVCDKESAPFLSFKHNGEARSLHVTNYRIAFPTTFFALKKEIACIVCDEIVLLPKNRMKEVLPIIKKRKFDVPYQIFEKAIEEGRETRISSRFIEVKDDMRVPDLAELLSISAAGVRHHLRNLKSEGVKLPEDYRWGNPKEFQEIAETIQARIGAHGRR